MKPPRQAVEQSEGQSWVLIPVTKQKQLMPGMEQIIHTYISSDIVITIMAYILNGHFVTKQIISFTLQRQKSTNTNPFILRL